NVNVVHSMWLFKHKFHADGSLSRYKARLVANRRSQQQALLQRIIAFLHNEFAMTDLGSLNYFLGISAQRSTSGMFLYQSKFVEEILERAHMQNCNPCKTLVDTKSKLGSDGDHVCLYMHDPCDPHFTALKRILRYVHGTLDYGLQLHVLSTTQLTAYTDADWAGCVVTRRSESEYHGVANVVAKTAWIRNLLCELHTPLFTATLVYCDNYADIFTKGLPAALFLEFRSSLNVQRTPVATEGEY
nr:hypothetical protein [Tanacetum cinerariifolium]